MPNFNDSFSDQINAVVDLGLQQQRNGMAPRDYLGASRMGIACGRALQYEFMHAAKDEDFSGRTLRIFEMGHAIEEMTREWLRQVGFSIVTTRNGQPLGFSAAEGRIKGHVDGVILDAPPELTMTFPALWECKSMNAKSWHETAEKGVRLSKPEYAAQIAVYQAYMPDLAQNPALFTAVNKDTAELYHERVEFDAALAQEVSDRAVEILKDTAAGQMFPRVTQDMSSFFCRFCSFFKTCWSGV